MIEVVCVIRLPWKKIIIRRRLNQINPAKNVFKYNSLIMV